MINLSDGQIPSASNDPPDFSLPLRSPEPDEVSIKKNSRELSSTEITAAQQADAYATSEKNREEGDEQITRLHWRE